MSKINKIATLCLVILIVSLIIANFVNADNTQISKYISYEDLCNNENLLCAQHYQDMFGANYNLVSTINITGNKSTANGVTIESWHNAKLASILSNPRGEADPETNVEYLDVQNAVWNYLRTWCSEVGYQHGNKTNKDFTNNAKGNYSTQIEKDAENYADNYKEGTLEDKTSKDKIKVTQYNEENQNYLRVGPFKYQFTGDISEVKVLTNKNTELEIKSFEQCIKEGQYSKIEKVESGEEFYISVKMPTDGSNEITKVIVENKMTVKHVEIKFWEHEGYSQQNLLEYTYNDEKISTETTLSYGIKLLGNLRVIKVNKDNQVVTLSGVGFYIQNKDTSKYIKQDAEGTVTYVDKKEDAKEFITDRNGKIEIKDLMVGTYVAYETKNPHYGYEIITEGKEKEVVVDKTAELKIPNKQKYIKLSGYVWVDEQSSKKSYTNDLYKTNEHPEIPDYVDDMDILLDGITVRLKDKTTGETVKETTTSNGGKYLFTDVLVDELDKYDIEFQYDGLTYTNVVPHIDKDNGSKASENNTVRDNFNKDFSVVEGKTENTGITKDSNNNEKHTLTYNLDKNAHSATLYNTGLYPITANTDEAGYSIKDHFILGQTTEIKNINLGLYEREQPDIALLKDLENVRVSINEYNHIYKAANRFNNAGTYEQGFNVGVKFGIGENEYGKMRYSAPVYKADIEYQNNQDKNRELKVYATYRIRVKNESSNLQVQVKSIADYYDARYTLLTVGTDLDNFGNPIGDITTPTTKNYGNNYSKAIIELNDHRINKQEYIDIFVQFELNKTAVLNILNGGDNLKNIAEINSYSVFDTNGNVYAGVDKDSNPGNIEPTDITTYQDDTDSAPPLKLEVANNREISGKVFLDNPTKENPGGVGKIRQGSGAYEENELGIEGVDVVLKDSNGEIAKIYDESKQEWKDAITSTAPNGDFTITGFIPGDYTLTYTWGDETYTVQSYKGTVYDSSRDQSNKNWHKENIETRLTDAMDDYKLRQDIDNEIKNVTGTTKTTINKMNSTTPGMGIGIEEATDGNTKYGITTLETISDGDEFVTVDFKIKNIDFGIVERARQDIELEKRVSTFKVTLANGQVIADVEIDEDGAMKGQTNYVTYMGPSALTSPNNGFVKIELDNELIQGATLEVGYEIKATNNSELDYLSEDFYKYGIIKGNLVTITPKAIIDYLDKDWAFDAEKNTTWEVKTLDGIKNVVAEVVYNNENSAIEDKTILYTDTESLAKSKLEPTQSAKVMLNVSRILANSDEIALDNETEVTKVEKTGGSSLYSTPGNYVPGTGKTENDDSTAETVIVTPSTGDNLNFIVPVMVVVIALAILATGVVLIKKKTL